MRYEKYEKSGAARQRLEFSANGGWDMGPFTGSLSQRPYR